MGEIQNIAFIRTSDRLSYKRCRRRWNWEFSLRGNLKPADQAEPFWTGTGVHFALEDRHGLRLYPDSPSAFRAYSAATARYEQASRGKYRRPQAYQEQLELAVGMLEYYELWLQRRDPLTTFVWNGRLQTEVRFEIEIPLDKELLTEYGYDRCLYQGTIDRMAIDDFGRLWVVEYKTAKQFATGHFDTDPQITAYCWAANLIYGQPIAGVVYQQHKKAVAKPPEFLKTRGMFSVNKAQKTTYALYSQALIGLYGSVDKAPALNVEFLNNLAAAENEHRDELIQRDFVERNEEQYHAEELKILLEAREMLNPKLPIYPNPTRDCQWQCSFLSACVALDSGADWQYLLDEIMVDREEERDSWRTYLQHPQLGREAERLNLLLGSQPMGPLPHQQSPQVIRMHR